MQAARDEAGGRLVLVRHGETQWSRSGRHTGRTDVPLTADGERQARELRPLLAGFAPVARWCSPASRARRTADLAGVAEVEVLPELAEWDYGGYEGLTTPQIRAAGEGDWTVFGGGPRLADPPGETLDEVAARCRRVLDRVAAVITDGDVIVVGHGHCLRVLTAGWLGADPRMGAQFVMAPASVGVLGHEHGVPAVLRWGAGPNG